MHMETTTKTPKTTIECLECGRNFKRTITARTVEIKCPGCGGYDTTVKGY